MRMEKNVPDLTLEIKRSAKPKSKNKLRMQTFLMLMKMFSTGI